MGKIGDGLDRAVSATYTRRPPASANARVRFLLRAERTPNRAEAARAVAARLGVSRRTVERYRDNVLRTPRPELAERIDAEVRRLWQPRVRRRAERRAATTTGVVVEARARFGFASAAGSTDDPRMRRITQHLPPEYARDLLDARAAGADEDELARIIAAGLQEVYFKDGGRRASDLVVEFTGIDYVEFDLGAG